MISSLSFIATASLYLLAVVDAAPPSKRQITGDNGACQQLVTTCSSAVETSLANVFAIESCVLAASCFSGHRPVDDFLAAVFASKNGAGTAPHSVNLPRVTTTVLNALSTNAKFISQQNFIDGFYRQLSVTNGPWPSSADVVINYFNRVAVWTAFCNGNIPFGNFQDYYQFSASVSSNGCSASTTIVLPPVTTGSPLTTITLSSVITSGIPSTVSSSVASSSAGLPTTTSSLPSSSGVVTSSSITTSSAITTSAAVTTSSAATTSAAVTTSSAATTSAAVTTSSATTTSAVLSQPATSSSLPPTTFASTTSSSSSPSTTPIVISNDVTCQKMFTTCVSQVNDAVTNIFSIKSCVLGATCFGGQRPVAGFVAAVYGVKHPSGTPPAPANEARVATAVFNAGSTDGKTWTQQNFIDAWYSQLSAVGGPFPPNANLVISYFNRVAGWTGFCGKGIPYMNFADYFQWSATVSVSNAQC